MVKNRTFNIIVIIIAVLILAESILYNYRSNSELVTEYETTSPYISYGEMRVCASGNRKDIYPAYTGYALDFYLNGQSDKVDAFELDLYLTLDNEIVIAPSNELDSFSDAANIYKENETISQLSLFDLKRLNIGYNFTSDDGTYPFREVDKTKADKLCLLSLEEVLKITEKDGNYLYLLNIRETEEAGKLLTDKLYSVLLDSELLDKSIVYTSDDSLSEYIDSTYEDLPRGATQKEAFIAYIKSMTDDSNYLPKYVSVKVNFGDFKKSCGINYGTAKFINYCHKNNISVTYTTINEKKNMEYLNSIDADIVITDYPNMLFKVIKSSLS